VAYRADIEIAVKGATQITNLRQQITALSTGVDNLNKSLRSGTVASIDNFNKLVSTSDRVMRSAVQGTRLQKQAIDTYVRSVAAAEKAENSLQRAIATRRKELGLATATTNAASRSRGGGGGRIGGAISGAVIGGSFPLLFGQGTGAAAGGAIGGLAGGLLGPGGSFAGSLLGTLLGDLASKGNAIKELATDIGFSAEQTQKLQEAFKLAGRDAEKFTAAVQNIRGLGLSIEDQADAIRLVSQLTETYGGRVDKVTTAFANALESGKVTQATINQLTNEGITVQDALAQKYGVSRDAILQMAKDGEISVQALADVLVDMGNKGLQAGQKPKTAFDQFTEALGNTATAVGNVASALLSVLGPAIDAITLKAAAALNALTETINTELLRTTIQNKTGQIVSPERLQEIEKEAMDMAARRFPSKAQGRQLAAGANIISPRAQQEFQILREQGIRNELQRFGYEQGILKVPTTAAPAEIGRIAAPGQLPPSGGKAAKAPADRSKQIFQDILRLQNQIRDASLEQVKVAIDATELAEGEAAALALQLSKFEEVNKLRIDSLNTERELAMAGAETGEHAALINQLYARKLQILQAQSTLEKQQLQRKASEVEVEKQLAAIARQREISTAVRNIRRERFSTELDVAAFTTPSKDIEQQRLVFEQNMRQVDATTDAYNRLKEIEVELSDAKLTTQARNTLEADKATQEAKIAAIQKELALLDQIEQKQLALQQFFTQYGQLISSVSEGIADAVTNGVANMVAGTQTAKQVFAQFLNTVAQALLDTAKKMIATYIAIGIAKIFAGLGGGGGSFKPLTNIEATNFSFNPAGITGGVPGGLFAKGGTFGASGTSKFASGGIVSSPTMFKFADGGTTRTGLMGEAGPEAIMPLRRGANGKLGVEANGLREALDRERSASQNNAPVLNMSFQSTTINGVEYVSRDQLEAAMAETRRQASREGAQRGMSMTLDKLQQSPSTRSRVGMR
jgi:lambda family phage tail tape measure protein